CAREDIVDTTSTFHYW
nr:immunoglobulin heavy chain junction region [Macaca mulatta]MOV90089.1 immunoglobulin heavy chain junction region [Macaca mulatta]